MVRIGLKFINFIFLILLIATAVVYQGKRAWSFMSHWIAPTTSILSTNPIERTAALSFHQDFGNFIHFFQTNVPEQATVVVLTAYPNGIEPIAFADLFQYFVFPRKLVFCSSLDTCQDSLQADPGKTYVVYQNGVPPQTELPSLHLKSFNDSLGIYIP